MTFIPTPIPAVLNHLLARESWARDKLAVHAGKVAVFEAGPVAVRLRIAADGMAEDVAADVPAHVTLRARLADLPLILQNRERAVSYVTIEGDADFANAISHVMQSLRWEAEADLSRLIGDVAAVRVVGAARGLAGGVRATQQKVAENLAEYFLEEKPVLVRPRAVNDFADEVARLRDDVERLEKRLSKLEGQR
ncbi:ubiquinone biosynthesis protein UbiJ [Noviherbaspirillum humi]|uniref:Ubiquinone biosynthesis accessory factor UbiJ n=1 Tax=Noviherbaspirillum humi TaxID=1688639 RepID=A0A239CMW6_9BURK|nr:SCP2 sterol-binding domain-containing protein [Noviherbaspirillum humi]SNS21031.1 ubiquinone biosynthesis protein UbiJ [Noviherbaspirillum humi]